MLKNKQQIQIQLRQIYYLKLEIYSADHQHFITKFKYANIIYIKVSPIVKLKHSKENNSGSGDFFFSDRSLQEFKVMQTANNVQKKNWQVTMY